MSTLLQVDLRAGYGKRTVLEHVKFELHQGERLGLVGTSGAGKSTLLLALFGLLRWKQGWVEGEVTLDGKNLLALSERQARPLRGKKLALVPQSPSSALNSALSLQAHLRHAWLAHETRCGELFQQRADALLRRVHLPGDRTFLGRRPGQISIGQAQRFSLVLALLHRPLLVVADEPTSALDPCTQAEVIDLLKQMSMEDGTALLFVSHDLLSVLRLCERVAVLDDGCLVEDLPAGDLPQATHPALQKLLQALPIPANVLLQHFTTRSGEGPESVSPRRPPKLSSES